MARLSDFNYELPDELIAQAPPAERDAARMLVVERASGALHDLSFRDLPSFLAPGDCAVLNSSRVIPSRLLGVTSSGAAAELFLLRPLAPLRWSALANPGRKLLPGKSIEFAGGLRAVVIAAGERGERTVEFNGVADADELASKIEEIGHIPLPPYIRRQDAPEDRERYQTVYAERAGSVAAPTAGLHFTPAMLDRMQAAGADLARVTLHVGLGTFQPIGREDFAAHSLHHERYEVSPDAWRAIENARRVVAIGTTSVRTIESVARTGRLAGETGLFLHPGAEFLRTQAMLTNFHLPQSSLLLLVCAFAGTDLTLAAYHHAVASRYRFFSYGDCMLIV